MEIDDQISDWDDDESLEDSDSEQFVEKATQAGSAFPSLALKSMQRVTRITGDLKVRKLNTIGETSSPRLWNSSIGVE